MYRSPSSLPEAARVDIARTLLDRLSDGLDLHSQVKLAHWNVRGPQFPSLHPMFERLAVALAAHNDTVAERAVMLGALAVGTARQVARLSRIPEYPTDITRDVDHTAAVADRIDVYLKGARETRGMAVARGDDDSADLMTRVIGELETFGWFLRATLA